MKEQPSASSCGYRMIDSSRFVGPVTGSLHGQQRRASALDIDSCIRVGMDRETAVTTGEAGLALATCLVDGSTRRTCLRCESGTDLNERPATLFQLVSQGRFKCAPALFKNAAIKAALPFAGSSHASGIQILNGDSPEPSRNASCDFMPPIGTNPRNFQIDSDNAASLGNEASIRAVGRGVTLRYVRNPALALRVRPIYVVLTKGFDPA